MHLVLAVHADARQTEQIAAALRKRLPVELVHAPSAGEGLQALADRVPDLILTSPLLSPFDEDVLAEYLRELGSAAAHVQTLRIPVLSAAEPSGGGLFSLGRKRRPEATPDGCNPNHFVEEIVVYLARAAEERRALAKHRTIDIRHADVDRARIPEPADIDSTSNSLPSDSESTFPRYQVEPIAHAEPERPTNRWDAFADDVAPIYQPPSEPSAPTYEPRTNGVTPTYESLMHTAPPIPDIPPGAPMRIYLPPPELIAPIPSPMSEPVTSISRGSGEPLALPKEAAPEELVSIYRSPSEQTEPVVHTDHDAVVMGPPADAHALVLEPPSRDSAAEQPFVVHSVKERMPLSESLERAAALLEASALGDPRPIVEQERVPLHNISSLVELPLPDGLAARVERSAPPAQEEAPASMPSQPGGSSLLLDASAHTFDPDPNRHAIARDPIAHEIKARPLAPTAATEPALDPRATAVQPEATATTPAISAAARSMQPPTPVTPAEHESTKASSSPGGRRTASFEAALAAIRKAWGPPRRSLSSNDPSSLQLNIGHTSPDPNSVPAPVVEELVRSKAATQPPIEETGAATPVGSMEKTVATPAVVPVEATVAAKPVVPFEETVATPMPQEGTDPEPKGQREVDLTLDIDALEDDFGTVTLVEPAPPEQVQLVAKPIEEDVYELSMSSGQPDVDADPVAAEPPPSERDVVPVTTSEKRVEESAPAPRRTRATPRKKSDERRPIKAQKAAPQPARENPEPVQDEWGLFDPNRCGFAALVDTLNKVTDDKEDKPSKTSVRVISVG